VNENYDVSLIVADGKGDELANGVDIIDVGVRAKSRIFRMIKTVKDVYKKAIELDGDLYHFHDPELMLVGLLLKKHGKKVVFDIHEDLPRQILRKGWIPTFLRKPLSWLIKKLEYYTAKKVDAVVTVTPEIASRFSFVKVTEVRNYVLLSEFDNSLLTQTLPIKKNLITYIGGISKDRGIVQMVESFFYVNDKLTLGGKFQGKGLQNHVEDLRSWDKVDFLGWQSRDMVSTLLSHSIIGLVVLQPTGDYENAFPVKRFEYMASGVAVISSDFPLWRDIVDGANCGLCVDSTSPSAIADAINQLIECPEKAIEMGINGRKAVIDKYNWNSEFDKLIKLYSELLR